MEIYRLIPHPAYPPERVSAVAVEVRAGTREILLTFKVEGADALALPGRMSPARKDELWKHTCFELFLQPVGGAQYAEFNFAPSTEWAAYWFDSCREGIKNLAVRHAPHVKRGAPTDDYVVAAGIDPRDMPRTALKMGLSAVIEEISGSKSYWALAHPPGDKPDFHHPDCFAAELSPASEP